MTSRDLTRSRSFTDTFVPKFSKFVGHRVSVPKKHLQEIIYRESIAHVTDVIT